MQQTSPSRRHELRSFLQRLALFFLVAGALYLTGIFVFASVKIADRYIIEIATRNPVVPGEFGFTFPRYQEIEHYGPVDIVFLGSSHAYRSFDPRLFARHGFTSFNMGTTGQTPVNSYFLLKRYLPRLQPRLVIFELYREVFARDGLESFYDLCTNIPFFPELMPMALAIRSPHAINGALGSWAAQVLGIHRNIVQQPLENEEYVPGGFIATSKVLSRKITTAKRTPKFVPLQLTYLRKTIELAQQMGAQIVLVSQPEPVETLAKLTNYDALHAHFYRIAAEYGVRYIDFNRKLPLQTYVHFADADHLNPAGVKIFDKAVIDSLARYNLLPQRASE